MIASKIGMDSEHQYPFCFNGSHIISSGINDHFPLIICAPTQRPGDQGAAEAENSSIAFKILFLFGNNQSGHARNWRCIIAMAPTHPARPLTAHQAKAAQNSLKCIFA